jgi:Mn-dependent transcriptional regulator
MAIQESGEMYLENILILKNKLGKVRSIDIANYASLSKPSVSRAMGILKRDGFIEIDGDGIINLTKEGAAIAHRIYERHVFLTELLIKIGVDPKTAAQDACKIEHDLSEETFQKLKAFALNQK